MLYSINLADRFEFYFKRLCCFFQLIINNYNVFHYR